MSKEVARQAWDVARQAREVGQAWEVARQAGEVARQAREEGLIGPEPYVASCWALLIATLVAPPLMRRALDARRRKRDAAGAAGEGGMASSGDASGRAGNSNDGPPSGARSNDGPPSGARSNDGPVGERTRGWRLGGVI